MIIARAEDKAGAPMLLLGITLANFLEAAATTGSIEIPLDGTGYPGKILLMIGNSDAELIAASQLGVIISGGEVKREDDEEGGTPPPVAVAPMRKGEGDG